MKYSEIETRTEKVKLKNRKREEEGAKRKLRREENKLLEIPNKNVKIEDGEYA